ncbi:MAG: phospholipase D-like domain-containing protein [Bacilli bacterium]|nr:phospholipase D-like domain-containing protein [Bacillales bacterium]MDY2575397.1 phospholipase D-like domain-containing protein [Bacilli bacterium]
MSIRFLIYSINSLLIIWFIFYQNKDYRSSLKWIFLFLLFPIISFLFYYFLGMGIKVDKKKYQNVEERINKVVDSFTPYHNFRCLDTSLAQYLEVNKILGASKMTYYNDIYYFTDGNDYYQKLLSDINNAKRSINIEMYIFRDDEFGNTLLDLLLNKAKQEVKVKILYDPNGNITNKRRWLKKYSHPNIQIVKTFSFYYRIRNFNYRNHKKIIVIDGEYAYLGGFNFGLEYASNEEKVEPFRDTQIKIYGEGVVEIQRQFYIDFYYAYSLSFPLVNLDIDKEDFQCKITHKLLPLQIISSSYSIRENIKRSRIKMLNLAKKEVYIQSPYFILDPLMNETLKLLLFSKVKVNIMIPLKYDQKIPFCATLANVRELYNLGARIYLYDGFIHSKVLIVDELYLVVGSSNFDIRSFSLNLEADALIYSKNEVYRYKNIFMTDVINSLEYSPIIEEKMFSSFKFGKRIFRLISSIM